MIPSHVLALLQCPTCAHPELRIGSDRLPTLGCEACGSTYPIIDGIPDLVPKTNTAVGQYRAKTLSNLIAGVYDVAAPMMSASVWNCSPLRYVDVAHRAIGRANPGILLDAPVATGIVLDPVLAPYHDVTVIGVDSSWNMLKKARRKLQKHKNVVLIRASLTNIPIQTDTVDSVQSLNGLHAMSDRFGAASEFKRVSKPNGYLAASSLIRGQELIADVVLERYERYGVYPTLRTAEFVMEELKQVGFENVRFETHGAVAFFSGQSPV